MLPGNSREYFALCVVRIQEPARRRRPSWVVRLPAPRPTRRLYPSSCPWKRTSLPWTKSRPCRLHRKNPRHRNAGHRRTIPSRRRDRRRPSLRQLISRLPSDRWRRRAVTAWAQVTASRASGPSPYLTRELRRLKPKVIHRLCFFFIIVWRARGKIIRSVLCSIVCNSCAQCNAHTYEQKSKGQGHMVT